MSRKLIQNLAIMSALAIGAGVVVACGDDDDDDNTADGSADGDEDGSADGDEDGSGDGDLPAGAIECGELTCERLSLQSGDLEPCCAEDAEGNAACGLDSENLQGEDKPACVLRDAPGVESTSCGAIWDLIDGEAEAVIAGDAGTPEPDGFYTTVVNVAGTNAQLQFNGCCTPAGTCSINFKDPSVIFGTTNLGPTDLGYGCADPTAVGLNLGSQAVGFGDSITCNPTTGAVTEEPATPDAGAGDGDAGGGDGDAGAGDAGATDGG